MMMQKDPNGCFPKPPLRPSPVTCAEVHTVVAGDTLYSISYKHNISVPVLMQVNKILNPYNLRVGQKICIPSRDPNGPVPSCGGMHYTVVAGDTLYLIAKKFNITLDSLMSANPTLDPYNLGVGMKLCIPEIKDVIAGDGTGDDNIMVPPPMPEVPSTPGNGGNNMGGRCPGGMIYNTQRGDTLSRVLDRFNVSYEALKKANPSVDFSGSIETLALCIPM